MNKHLLILMAVSGMLLASCNTSEIKFQPEENNSLRAPAYPLVTIDPYTSAWSFTNNLYDDAVRHWTGKAHPLVGALRVDGKSYRFMGVEDLPLSAIIPNAALAKWDATYMEKEPSGKWTETDYDDSSWNRGKAAFGTSDMPHLSTAWNSKDIWVRRTFELDKNPDDETIFLEYSHDDIFELYINGIQVISTGYTWKNNVLHELSREIKATLKPGKNVIAAHCHNRVGGGYVDFGLYRKENIGDTFAISAIQRSAQVLPTQTYYTFECGPVELSLVFTSPLLMDNLELLSTPINYISYQVKSLDGNPHEVQIYLDATPQWAQDTPGQEMVDATSPNNGNGKIEWVRTGTKDQPVLQKKGDDVRIDWGYFYLATEKKNNIGLATGNYFEMKKSFAERGNMNIATPSQATRTETVLAFSEDLGQINTPANGFLMIGYDDLYAIQYFKDNRMAYWKQDGKIDITQAFEKAAKNYSSVMEACRRFDSRMMKDAEKAGNREYAELCALAYRQAIAAHKLITDKEGNLLFFSKENFSNGSIGTVDITYPSSPLFLIYNPELLKGMMNPIFYYSESGQWNKPFAAHDVGTYPLANGQTYGGDMPLEESGNMLILTTAIAIREGNADYAKKHWQVLTTWANYLIKEGLDPANQLCTDDFAGHFAHNANLSIKAIMGIAGYGKLAAMLGYKEISEKYTATAQEMANQWIKMADDGDHFRLTFDQPGTWSQKYNLIWDHLLGFNLFPKEVAQKEMAYYMTKQNVYGLPLDNREDYTKSDWIMWSACLTGSPQDFSLLVKPVWKYANETPTRVPLSDWHYTSTGEQRGFQARSVVGGYFMKMLEEKLK